MTPKVTKPTCKVPKAPTDQQAIEATRRSVRLQNLPNLPNLLPKTNDNDADDDDEQDNDSDYTADSQADDDDEDTNPPNEEEHAHLPILSHIVGVIKRYIDNDYTAPPVLMVQMKWKDHQKRTFEPLYDNRYVDLVKTIIVNQKELVLKAIIDGIDDFERRTSDKRCLCCQ